MESKKKAKAGPPKPKLPSRSYGESPLHSGRVQLGITPTRGAVKLSCELSQNSEKSTCPTPDSPLPIYFVLMVGQVAYVKGKSKEQSEKDSRLGKFSAAALQHSCVIFCRNCESGLVCGYKHPFLLRRVFFLGCAA